MTSATSSSDREAVAALLGTFFAAFTSGPDVGERVQGLRALFLPGAVVVRTCGDEPQLLDVDAFVSPRAALLTAGSVQEFREWELDGRTELFGDVASHVCSYAKSWVQDGTPATGRGVKALHLVRTAAGWRISSLVWDDERDGVRLPG